MAEVTLDQVRGTYKTRDSWWTVLLVDPVAGRLVRLLVGHTWLTPTRLTVTAFLLGLAAAAAFLQAEPAWLVVGALLYHLGFILDCVDGKIARLRGEGSVVGSWLDFVLDRLRVVLCTAALFGGQFLATEQGGEAFLFAAVVVVFLSLFGYVNGAEIDKARQRMAGAHDPGSQTASVDPGEAGPPSRLARLADALHQRRIRLNLVSAIEFEMALFVVAPLLAAALGGGAIIGSVAVAGALLVAFEMALIVRFWLTARAFDRRSRPTPMPVQRDGTQSEEGTRTGR